MPTFAMFSTLGPHGSATLSDNPERLREVKSEVEAMGVTVVHQWAMLGQWDFLNVIEAESEAEMARVATALAARGTLKTRTLILVDVEDYITELKKGL